MPDPREAFARTAAALVDEDRSVALVYAEISGQYFTGVQERHPDRVVNVGIREQLLVNVGAGLALSGLRPIVHTFSSFLVERAFEQIKLGFSHQDVGGVLVGSAGSFDVAAGGRTHQTPGTLPCSTRSRTGPCTCRVMPRRWRQLSGRPCTATGGTTSGWSASRTRRRTRLLPGGSRWSVQGVGRPW
jgi:hypothetical protein